MGNDRRGHVRTGVAVLAALLCLLGLTPLAAAADGEVRSLVITAPDDGAELPPGAVEVAGTLGAGPGAATDVVFVVDVSGSTTSPRQDCTGDGVVDSADDLNGDGTLGDVLDCELAGVASLIDSLPARTDIRFGLVGFGASAAPADVSAAPGQQTFAAADDVAAMTELRESLNSFRRGQILEFTPRTPSSFSTNFSAPLAGAGLMFDAARATGRRANEVVYFLSDGRSSIRADDPAITTLAARGTSVNTYGIGGSASGCEPTDPLRIISDQLSGVCATVQDPSTLLAALTATVTAPVDVTVTNLGDSSTVGEQQVDADGIGRWAATFDGLVPGTYEAVAVSGQLTDQVTFTVVAPLEDPGPVDAPDPSPENPVDPGPAPEPTDPSAGNPVEPDSDPTPEPTEPTGATATASDDLDAGSDADPVLESGDDRTDDAARTVPEVLDAASVAAVTDEPVGSDRDALVGDATVAALALTGVSPVAAVAAGLVLLLAGAALAIVGLMRARRRTTR